MDDKTYNVIRSYFEKIYSDKTRARFAWWMINDDKQEEKEAAMQQLWDGMPYMGSSIKTLDDLSSTHEKIIRKQSRNKVAWLKYAAVIMAVVVSSAITYFAVSQQQISKENTRSISQLSVPDGGLRTITLPDGTQATVDAGSTLLYPSTFYASSRKVFLVGKASFKVAHDSAHPFFVCTRSMDVKAVGTHFDVESWPNAPLAATTLLEGRTNVTFPANKRMSSYDLKPGQRLAYNSATGKVTISNVDAGKQLSWTNGDLVFDGATIQEIVATLQRHYNIHVYTDGIGNMNGLYHLKFNAGDSVEKVLGILSRIDGGFTYTKKGKDIYIIYR